MDPPPRTTTAATKLRLMCSYGGHIMPHPNTKSLVYSGGDTRIITLPTTAASTTLSTLTSHLSTTLNITTPFTLKYQLPNHDLDSLITVSTDEDLLIMLEEHHRLSPARARIRLFLFPPVKNAESKVMTHPKSDSWFVDALKNSKIGGGGGGEGQCEGQAESIVLETSSSFGSTSSSASLSNLPAKTQLEDATAACFQDSFPVKSIASVPPAVSHPQMVAYQEIGDVPVAVTENKVSFLKLVESESRIADVATEVEMNRIGQVSGFPLSLQFDQPQQVQFVPADSTPVHYVPHNPTGVMPASPYYVVNPPVPQQQLYYQANQPQPIYLIPVAQPYSIPMQSGAANNTMFTSGHPPLHPNPSSNPAQVAYKVTSASPAPELASQVHRTVHMATPIIDVSHKENNQLTGGVTQMNHQAKAIGVTSTETADYGNELDEPLHVQIYKSQPPAPILPSQYQTMTNAATVLLSGAFTQLHTDNIQRS